MSGFKLSLVIALIAAIAIIILQNTTVISLRLLFWTVSMSQILLFLMLVIAGFVLGYVTARLSKP